MNYSIQEYCSDIIEVIMSVLDDRNIEHPTVVTESGRATVAYYSVLIFNVLDETRFEVTTLPEDIPGDANEVILNLMDVAQNINSRNIQECFNDALYYRDEVREVFRHGGISLRERSSAEQIFWYIINEIAKEKTRSKRIPRH